MMKSKGPEQLSVGNRIIDSAHNELLHILDWMEHLIEVEDLATLSLAFETLLSRLSACFAVEEQVAKAVDLDFARHQTAHQSFLGECKRIENELMLKYGRLPKADVKKYVGTLRNSLVQHILNEGTQFKRVLVNYAYDFKPNGII